MKRKTLIRWSMARDALNFLGIGAVPPVSLVLDLPLYVMHFEYAGSAAAFTLLEMIPVVGLFPFFTVAALSYPDRDAKAPGPPTHGSTPPAAALPPPTGSPAQSGPGGDDGVFAVVNGERVPITFWSTVEGSPTPNVGEGRSPLKVRTRDRHGTGA